MTVDPSPLTADDVVTHAQLRALSEHYAAAADARDPGRFVSAFHPDATLTVELPDDAAPRAVERRGHAQIGEVPGLLGRYPKTFHLLGQSTYEVHGDDAMGEVYCTAHHLSRGEEPTSLVMFIRYHDTYRRRGGRWAISARRVAIQWTETRGADGPRT